MPSTTPPSRVKASHMALSAQHQAMVENSVCRRSTALAMGLHLPYVAYISDMFCAGEATVGLKRINVNGSSPIRNRSASPAGASKIPAKSREGLAEGVDRPVRNVG